MAGPFASACSTQSMTRSIVKTRPSDTKYARPGSPGISTAAAIRSAMNGPC
jgi:hypothetical protein